MAPAPLCNFRLPIPEREAIDRLAARAGVNRSEFVRAAVAEMQQQHPDVIRERVEALSAGRSAG
jgi:Arc/MetJ-type ribon-helix-helix transcriptional regulator